MNNILDHPGRGRPKKEATMDALSLRVPDELVEKIDRYTALLQEELPLSFQSQADAIRQLIAVGLKAEKSGWALTIDYSRDG